jgi:hypothetical protein
VAHRQPKDIGSQSGAQDVRRTPGKMSKPPPMGGGRKIMAREQNRKHKARTK